MAFHYGLTLITPLSLGLANVAASLVMVVLAFSLGVPPGIGTLVSVIVVGFMIDVLIVLVPPAAGWLDGYTFLLAGVVCIALGSALVVKARLGAGPRDSFMLAMTAITGRRIGLVRTGIEVAALILGALMGSPIGLGTIVYAVAVGPATEFWFRIFGLKAPKRRRKASEEGAST